MFSSDILARISFQILVLGMYPWNYAATRFTTEKSIAILINFNKIKIEF